MKKSKMVLQTKLANAVFQGQRKGPVGVPQFSQMINEIWSAAERDDPFADQFLLRSYSDIVSTRKLFRQHETHYRNLILSQKNIEIKLIQSKKPIKLPLSFKTPYGFMASYLVSDLDVLVQLLITAKKMGFLTEEHKIVLRKLIKCVRIVLSKPMQWKDIAITRKDIREGNKLSQQAIKHMGLLNKEVLNGTLRSPHSPEIKSL